jgi:hypothetical protein
MVRLALLYCEFEFDMDCGCPDPEADGCGVLALDSDPGVFTGEETLALEGYMDMAAPRVLFIAGVTDRISPLEVEVGCCH